MFDMTTVYETLYIALATKGRITFKTSREINLESVRVGWYQWRKQNSLILGPKAKMKLSVTPDSENDSVTLSLEPKGKPIEFELL